MKKTVILFCILATAVSFTNAQVYSNAGGIRLGPNSAAITSGFTFKHFLDQKRAVEAILGVNNGVGLCGLYEIHFPFESVKNLQWFAGFGAYTAFRSHTNAAFGVTGIAGLDYKFEEVPLNISLDWKPELNLISTVGFESSGLGVSARFVF